MVLREELNLEIQALERNHLKSLQIKPNETLLSSPERKEEKQITDSYLFHTTSYSPLSTTSLPTTTTIDFAARSQLVASPSPPILTNSTFTQTSAMLPTSTDLISCAGGSITSEKIVGMADKSTPNESLARTLKNSNSKTGISLDQANTEISKILARIEQDNRLLAELEKTRATIDLPCVPPSAAAMSNCADKENILQLPVFPKQPITRQELEKLMLKLEQDNKVLAELDKKRSILESKASTGMPFASPSLGSLRDPPPAAHGLSSSVSAVSLHRALLSSSPAVLPASLLQRLAPLLNESETALSEEEMLLNSIDFIELPGRGRCNIYCARYTYDPLKQSPNENPEAELSLNAGDYVIIYGDMDEDGFFNGELLDGNKGLVPSNFVEKLTGEELFEFHTSVLYGNRDSDDSSVSFSYAQDMEMTVSDDFLHPEDLHRMNDYIDMDEIEDLDQDDGREGNDKDNDNFVKGVPPPQRLILERQMNKSLLLGWLPPDPPAAIEGYHVYVDGLAKCTVQFSERTRALIEGVDSLKPHRVSVRSISSTGFHSKDAACTIVVGKDFPLAPTCVRASHITASSAFISWLPSNSNFQHVVAVNSVEVKVVKPGCFRHNIMGLAPNNLYRVSVRVKPGKLLYNDEKNPRKLEMLVSNVEFRTLPKGLPDPPVNVQVEQGPQDGTLLVTWLPVLTSAVNTLVSAVTGYAVFAAGKKIAEIDSPSGDHALIDGSHLVQMNKKCITVRSKSEDGLSIDSLSCTVPNDLLRNVQKTVLLRSHDERRRRTSSSDSESDSELAELLNHVNRRARAFDPLDSPFKAEAMDEEGPCIGGHTELADIAEEEEETMDFIYENKSKMLCRLQSIDEYEDGHRGVTLNKFKPNTQDYHCEKMALLSNHAQMRNREEQCPSYNDKDIHEFGKHGREEKYLKERSKNRIPLIAITQEEELELQEGEPRKRAPARKRPNLSGKPRSHGNSYTNPTHAQQNRVRFFVALFDYDPQTMSPNPDAADEELPFQEGQIIKIYGDKDPDGFYRGESNGRSGLVPGNMVSEVADRSHSNANENKDIKWQSRKIKRMVAIYDYDCQEISSNNDTEVELSFNVGDVIYVIGDVDTDGYYMGELNGVKGLVPSNFLREAPAHDTNFKGSWTECGRWNEKESTRPVSAAPLRMRKY